MLRAFGRRCGSEPVREAPRQDPAREVGVACPADDLSDPTVIATTASQGLRHGSVSGTLGFAERLRAAREGDFPFDYRGVAAANMGLVNVCGPGLSGAFFGHIPAWKEQHGGMDSKGTRQRLGTFRAELRPPVLEV